MRDRSARKSAGVTVLEQPRPETRGEAIARHLRAAERLLGASETPPPKVAHGGHPAMFDPFLIGSAQAHALLALALELLPDDAEAAGAGETVTGDPLPPSARVTAFVDGEPIGAWETDGDGTHRPIEVEP